MVRTGARGLDILRQAPAARLGPFLKLRLGVHRRGRIRIRHGLPQAVDHHLRCREAGIEEDSPAFQAIGYRELAAHLRGDITLDQATSALLQATRRYAKRQLTWFRGEPGIRWFVVDSRERLSSEVLDYLAASGLQGSP